MLPTPQPLQDYAADLHALASMVADPQAVDQVLERALEALQAVVPYELAAVFRLQEERLRLVSASGPLADRHLRGHALDLSALPSVRRALELRRPLAMSAVQHAEEGDPFDGILDFPHGHACMVVPLFARDRSLGIITLDRSSCGSYTPSMVDLAGTYGQLISLAMLFADQAALLDRYRHQLREQNRLLVEEAGGADQACRHLEASRSPLMQQVVRLARQVAGVELPVLIQGETGTGKEVLAQAIHHWSPRADAPFIRLNCSAIPEALVESELFGHTRGAFSGADRERRGRFLSANGGSILLDEVGDMPLPAQAKLLRVLQEGTFEPVGSDTTVRVDVRVLAATNVDLERAMRGGRFREDLYYRLAVFPLRIPPLRQRTEDIAAIAERFLEGQSRRGGRGPWRLGEAALQALRGWSWPGNVRELINVLERALILQTSGELQPTSLGLPISPGGVLPLSGSLQVGTEVAVSRLPPALEPLPSFVAQERAYLEALLHRTGGRLYGPDGAASLSGLKPTTLRSKLMKHGLR